MSTQTATMSNSYSPSARRPGFFQGLVKLIFFVAGVTGIMVLIFHSQVNLPIVLMAVLADGIVALAAGIGSRIFFYRRSGFTRYFFMMIALILGLSGLGYFTKWQTGIGPLEPWLAGKVDWLDLVQVCGGFLVGVFALRAWWRTPTSESEIRIHHPGKRSRSRSTASAQAQRIARPSQFHVPESWSFPSKGKTRTSIPYRSNGRGHASPEVERIVVGRPAKPARSRRNRLFSRKPDLQISTYEEHRCPYCFDVVKRNDPRGVKECDVCHTLHHADCWDITGSCQVPHLNKL